MAVNYQLAQINISQMLAPLDDPIMAEFVNRLPEINTLAEGAPGFIWRLQTPAGNATELRVFDDDWIIVNMSVWESIDALYQYTYFSDHTDVLRKRAGWFSKLGAHSFALWWIPEGHIPTPEEGKLKLETLWTKGITPLAFTFKKQFTVEEILAYIPDTQKDS